MKDIKTDALLSFLISLHYNVAVFPDIRPLDYMGSEHFLIPGLNGFLQYLFCVSLYCPAGMIKRGQDAHIFIDVKFAVLCQRVGIRSFHITWPILVPGSLSYFTAVDKSFYEHPIGNFQGCFFCAGNKIAFIPFDFMADLIPEYLIPVGILVDHISIEIRHKAYFHPLIHSGNGITDSTCFGSRHT